MNRQDKRSAIRCGNRRKAGPVGFGPSSPCARIMAQAETVGLGRTSVARSFVVILAALVALGIPRSALAQGADSGTFRIGATMSITGKAYSVQGGYGREGYLLCQKQLNAGGGLLGRPVEL